MITLIRRFWRQCFWRFNESFKSLYIQDHQRIGTGNKRKVIVDIVFPLVSTMEFQIVHVVPIPTEHQGNQITIVPESKYLMMTLQKDNFYQISEKEFHTCMNPKARRFICSFKMYTAQSTKSRCERDLWMQANQLNPNCRFNVTHEKNFWISLSTKNQLIFGLNNKATLNVICGNKAQPMAIQVSGLLEIAPGCEVTQPDMTLITEAVERSDGDFNYYPSFNLSEAVVKSGRTHKYVFIMNGSVYVLIRNIGWYFDIILVKFNIWISVSMLWEWMHLHCAFINRINGQNVGYLSKCLERINLSIVRTFGVFVTLLNVVKYPKCEGLGILQHLPHNLTNETCFIHWKHFHQSLCLRYEKGNYLNYQKLPWKYLQLGLRNVIIEFDQTCN